MWIKKNIAAFGGNPNDVTIMGQSGGGYSVVSQIVMYDGDSQGLFKKLSPVLFNDRQCSMSDLADRNTKYFSLLNCTTGQAQLGCFRNASVPALVNAYNSLSIL
jgi:carboxylesterase type B